MLRRLLRILIEGHHLRARGGPEQPDAVVARVVRVVSRIDRVVERVSRVVARVVRVVGRFWEIRQRPDLSSLVTVSIGSGVSGVSSIQRMKISWPPSADLPAVVGDLDPPAFEAHLLSRRSGRVGSEVPFSWSMVNWVIARPNSPRRSRSPPAR